MDGPACIRPWNHPDNVARPASVGLLLDGAASGPNLCLDCAAVALRGILADTRRAQITGTPEAASTIVVGPVAT